MDITEKRALYTTLLFGSLFLFLLIFFLLVGADIFVLESKAYLFAITGIFVVLTVYFTMLLKTGKDKKQVDERAKDFIVKGSQTGLLLTALYVFLVSIILFVIYEDSGSVPVGWLWFIAYSTFAFTYFSTSLSILLQYRGNHAAD